MDFTACCKKDSGLHNPRVKGLVKNIFNMNEDLTPPYKKIPQTKQYITLNTLAKNVQRLGFISLQCAYGLILH